MNLHFVAGRRRRRRHHPLVPPACLLGSSLFWRNYSSWLCPCEDYTYPPVRLESRGGTVAHLHANEALGLGGAASPSKICGAGAFSGGTCSGAAAPGTGAAGPRGLGRAASPRTRRKQTKRSLPQHHSLLP